MPLKASQKIEKYQRTICKFDCDLNLSLKQNTLHFLGYFFNCGSHISYSHSVQDKEFFAMQITKGTNGNTFPSKKVKCETSRVKKKNRQKTFFAEEKKVKEKKILRNIFFFYFKRRNLYLVYGIKHQRKVIFCLKISTQIQKRDYIKKMDF